MKTRPIVTVAVSEGVGERSFEVRGRPAQTLLALVRASQGGITALEMASWALRLAHYVFVLRTEFGLDIETRRERHETSAGVGWHARYVLHSSVRIIDLECGHAKAA